MQMEARKLLFSELSRCGFRPPIAAPNYAQHIVSQAGPRGRKRLHHLEAPRAPANEDLL